MLKVAIAYAKSGDREKAMEVAQSITLAFEFSMSFGQAETRFDFRSPRTWGARYEMASTFASYHWADQCAADVAGAAMTLAQALGQPSDVSYSELFNDVIIDEVTMSLARAQAASGDVKGALSWARQVGSERKVQSSEDFKGVSDVRRRTCALMGVAKGILDLQVH